MISDEDVDDLNELFDDDPSDGDENNHNEQRTPGNDTTTGAEAGFTPVTAPKRKIIKNPRLKFDADRLNGPRGIPVIVNHFKDVKFKGKGHEIEDLNHLLSTLELWTHRLYPSMKFEDTLKHIEKLGKKRAVQVCVQKIRLDMPILNSDFIGQDDDDDDNILREDSAKAQSSTTFDNLLEEHQRNMQETGDLDKQITEKHNLTNEQVLKIQQNRKLAEERRKARLSQHTQDSQHIEAIASTSRSVQRNDEEECDIDELVHNTWLKTSDNGRGDRTSPSFDSKMLTSQQRKIYNDSDEDSFDVADNYVDHSIKSSLRTDDPDEIYGKPSKRVKQKIVSDSDESSDKLYIADSDMNQFTESPLKDIKTDSSRTDGKSSKKNSQQPRILSDSDEDSYDKLYIADTSTELMARSSPEKPAGRPNQIEKISQQPRILSDSDEDSYDKLYIEANSTKLTSNNSPEKPAGRTKQIEKISQKPRILSDSDEDSYDKLYIEANSTKLMAKSSPEKAFGEEAEKPKQIGKILQRPRILSDSDEELSGKLREEGNSEQVLGLPHKTDDIDKTYEKPAKRPRILSDEDSCDIDGLVEGTFFDD